MKILVTGMGAKQVNSDRSPLKIMTNCGTLVDVLREQGHEVDWRHVIPGDSTIDRYDKVICFLAPLLALTSRHAYGVLWTLARRPDAIHAFDDWQLRQIALNAKSVLKYDEKNGCIRVFKEFLPRSGRLEAKVYENEILEQVEALTRPTTRRAVLPMFKGGDPVKLGIQPHGSYCLYDPSPLWVQRYGEVAARARKEQGEVERADRWIHASLLNKQPWIEKQGFTWDVDCYGNFKLKQPRVDEEEIVKLCCSARGFISSPHSPVYHGWWRVRHIIAHVTESIMYGQLSELKFFGLESNYDLKAVEREKYGSDTYKARVTLQSERYNSKFSSIDELHKQVAGVIE